MKQSADLGTCLTLKGKFPGIRTHAIECSNTRLPPAPDITYSSHFIREPGPLAPQVSRHLKIDTDERGTCQREEGGRCVESDDIFSLSEQRNARVETDPRARRVELRAGHVEIVGDKRVAPTKLIAVLQEEGVIRPTAPERRTAFSQLLARVYQDHRHLNQDVGENPSQP